MSRVMMPAIARSQRPWSVFRLVVASAALLGLSGTGYALDAKSNARANISIYKTNIKTANLTISNRASRILAGDILIIAAEAGLREAKKKKDNTAAVIALELSLSVLKSKKADLVKEKQQWERYKSDCQTKLAQWEAYLRKLGG